jgi:translation initiation factor IF-3
LKINNEIRASQVRVIGKDGVQLGIMNLAEALALADKEGLDLIEIASNAKPPVCKIIDYGKYRYHQTKKEKESRKTQHYVKVKEIKFKPNIDIHDFQTKVKRGREFIEKGCKVRVTCMFRGREMLHMDLGEKVIVKFCEALQDIAHPEVEMKKMGRTMTVVLAPVGKKQKH